MRGVWAWLVMGAGLYIAHHYFGYFEKQNYNRGMWILFGGLVLWFVLKEVEEWVRGIHRRLDRIEEQLEGLPETSIVKDMIYGTLQTAQEDRDKFEKLSRRRLKGKVEEKVGHIIVEMLGVDESEVTPDASFVDDLGADSLDAVQLLMVLEEEFGIEIPDEDAEKIVHVNDAVDYIKNRVSWEHLKEEE